MFEPTEEQRRLIEIKKEIREEMRRQKKEDARRSCGKASMPMRC